MVRCTFTTPPTDDEHTTHNADGTGIVAYQSSLGAGMFRRWASTPNPDTPLQQITRLILDETATAWTALTQAEREAWDTAAPGTMTGKNYYCQVNVYRTLYDQPTTATPPTFTTAPTISLSGSSLSVLPTAPQTLIARIAIASAPPSDQTYRALLEFTAPRTQMARQPYPCDFSMRAITPEDNYATWTGSSTLATVNITNTDIPINVGDAVACRILPISSDYVPSTAASTQLFTVAEEIIGPNWQPIADIYNTYYGCVPPVTKEWLHAQTDYYRTLFGLPHTDTLPTYITSYYVTPGAAEMQIIDLYHTQLIAQFPQFGWRDPAEVHYAYVTGTRPWGGEESPPTDSDFFPFVTPSPNVSFWHSNIPGGPVRRPIYTSADYYNQGSYVWIKLRAMSQDLVPVPVFQTFRLTVS